MVVAATGEVKVLAVARRRTIQWIEGVAHHDGGGAGYYMGEYGRQRALPEREWQKVLSEKGSGRGLPRKGVGRWRYLGAGDEGAAWEIESGRGHCPRKW